MGMIFGGFGRFDELDVPPPDVAGTVPDGSCLPIEDEVRRIIRRNHPVVFRCERIIGIVGMATLGALVLPVVLSSIAIVGGLCIGLLDLYVWVLCHAFQNDGAFMSLSMARSAWHVLTVTGHPRVCLMALIFGAILLGKSIKSGHFKALAEYFGRLLEAENVKVLRAVSFIKSRAWKDPSVGGSPFRGRPFQRVIWKREGQVVGSLEWDAISGYATSR